MLPLLLTLLNLPARAASTDGEVREPHAVKKHKDDDPIQRSWFPIVGYNPTYGVFAGGGFFFDKKDTIRFGSHWIVTQTLVAQVQLDVTWKLSQKWVLDFSSEVAKGFEPNFGAGNASRAEDRVNVPMSRWLNRLSVLRKVSQRMRVGACFDLRQLRRKELDPEDAAVEVDPYGAREDSLAMGLCQDLNYRNNDDNPTFGWIQEFSAKVVPAGLQTAPAILGGDETRTYGLFDGNLRMFQQLGVPELVMAFQIAGGIAAGTPNYLYQFRLGGTDRLRGYFDNRFRGPKYYVQQTELRFPIYKIIGGAAFLEFGEVTTGKFEAPSASHGIGLRVGIPPDNVAKVRLDVAFGKDQSGVFLDFGHAF